MPLSVPSKLSGRATVQIQGDGVPRFIFVFTYEAQLMLLSFSATTDPDHPISVSCRPAYIETSSISCAPSAMLCPCDPSSTFVDLPAHRRP